MEQHWRRTPAARPLRDRIPRRYVHWKLAIEARRAPAHGRAGGRGLRPRLRRSSSTATTSASTSSSPTPSSACASSTPRCARRGHERQGPRLLRRRQHLHARHLDPRLQGELLQVHQRDAARARGRLRALRASSSLAARQRHRVGRRLRAGAGLRRDPARRRRQLGGVAARGAAARRAAGHRRPHARRRQAQGAARPRRRLLAPRRGHQGQARGASGGWSTRRSRSRKFTARVAERAKALAAQSRPTEHGPGRRAGAARRHATATTASISLRHAGDRCAPRASPSSPCAAPDAAAAADGRGACASAAASCGRCAPSASWTTRCSTCASTIPRSAWSCCKTAGDADAVLALDAALDAAQRRLVRARGPLIT